MALQMRNATADASLKKIVERNEVWELVHSSVVRLEMDVHQEASWQTDGKPERN